MGIIEPLYPIESQEGNYIDESDLFDVLVKTAKPTDSIIVKTPDKNDQWVTAGDGFVPWLKDGIVAGAEFELQVNVSLQNSRG